MSSIEVIALLPLSDDACDSDAIPCGTCDECAFWVYPHHPYDYGDDDACLRYADVCDHLEVHSDEMVSL